MLSVVRRPGRERLVTDRPGRIMLARLQRASSPVGAIRFAALQTGAGRTYNLAGRADDRWSDALLNPAIHEEQRLDRPALRELQSAKLRRLMAEIVPANAFWSARLAAAGIEVSAIRSVAELLNLPLATKVHIAEDQQKSPPYGTNLTYPLDRYVRLHETSGTTGDGMRWLDTPESWDWFMRCWAIIYDACGVRAGDRFFFPFSFGPFIGFWRQLR